MPPPSNSDRGQDAALPPAATERNLWLRVGALIDGSGAKPLRNAQIVYNRDAIQWVGGERDHPPAQLLKPVRARPDFDLPSHTLLPGLIEAHAHLFLEGGELDAAKRASYLNQSSEALLQGALPRLEKLVRLGVAAVRDAGDRHGVGLALSRLYSSPDRLLMPYLDSPGAAIHRRGRYGSFMSDPLDDCASLAACVESRVKAGADRIKLIPTGIINFKQGRVTAPPQMSAAEVAEIVTAAKSFGRQTFAHASGDDGIENAIQGGVDSVEHGFFVRPDQLAQMRDRQIAWVPTFAPAQEQVDHADLMGWDAAIVSHLKKILDQHAASLVNAHQLGVTIIAGSDAGSYGVAHGLGLLRELELMERAGLPSLAVIASATGASAGRLAFKEKFGLIRPGHLSRFILTRHSPLDGVANLSKLRRIVFDHHIFDTGPAADTSNL